MAKKILIRGRSFVPAPMLFEAFDSWSGAVFFVGTRRRAVNAVNRLGPLGQARCFVRRMRTMRAGDIFDSGMDALDARASGFEAPYGFDTYRGVPEYL